eukprot:CAMPEP_0117001346 /NCGR_PEP_ID=MMETSP0472-20121206/3378_1 /TAXON_ID=693140 ORGANISM="Tiarina fusus, Strain LIS" /NCGR_SAMPLE_ID=MMETSP0472 /ASSEMBLY_ACC=CAM_ASM_000603 /LENGTH=612 /DNA_ID=CAMNT_0004701327 /DNA_START=245 /DNA_END=2080 /DNA_ORIENTATION=-
MNSNDGGVSDGRKQNQIQQEGLFNAALSSSTVMGGMPDAANSFADFDLEPIPMRQPQQQQQQQHRIDFDPIPLKSVCEPIPLHQNPMMVSTTSTNMSTIEHNVIGNSHHSSGGVLMTANQQQHSSVSCNFQSSSQQPQLQQPIQRPPMQQQPIQHRSLQQQQWMQQEPVFQFPTSGATGAPNWGAERIVSFPASATATTSMPTPQQQLQQQQLQRLQRWNAAEDKMAEEAALLGLNQMMLGSGVGSGSANSSSTLPETIFSSNISLTAQQQHQQQNPLQQPQYPPPQQQQPVVGEYNKQPTGHSHSHHNNKKQQMPSKRRAQRRASCDGSYTPKWKAQTWRRPSGDPAQRRGSGDSFASQSQHSATRRASNEGRTQRRASGDTTSSSSFVAQRRASGDTTTTTTFVAQRRASGDTSFVAQRRASGDTTTTTFVAQPRRASGDSHFVAQRRSSGESATGGRTPKIRVYQREKWWQRYEELAAFYKEHGHSEVAKINEENRELARWVKRQRFQYQSLKAGLPSSMTPERIQALEEVKFVWDSHSLAWEARFQELKAYKERFHSCNVPSTYQENPSLAAWVKSQRRQYRNFHEEGASSNITLERIQLLEEIGFQW